MRNRKSNKKHKEDSSTESGRSPLDSSNSSSDSRNSSPIPKKSRDHKNDIKDDKRVKTQQRSEEDQYNIRNTTKRRFEDENVTRTVERDTIEKSKWDSPQEKFIKKERKIDKRRTSDSMEKTDRTTKSTSEKKSTRYKDRQEDYQGSRSEDRHRFDKEKQYNKEHKTDKFDRRRNNYSEDRNKRNRADRKDNKEYSTTSHDFDRYHCNRRDDRNYNSRKHNRDRSNSGEANRNPSSSHQNRYRNRRHRSRSASLDKKEIKWGKEDDKPIKTERSKDKEKPNFSLSGKLTEETNTYKGVVIKYSEPPEARKPKRRWRLYPFKGEKALQTLYIHRESAYLIGRERKVVDLPVDHPSCSKQHAVLQYRLVPFTREDGSIGKKVRPYLIDLDSANGTFINNKKVEPRKYVELLEKDVIKFGFSSREYVLLHENSKDEAQDDDVKEEEEVCDPVKKEKE